MLAVSYPTTHQTPVSSRAASSPIADLMAFNALVLEYQDIVYRHACNLLNDPVAAEDATQEAFLRAYNHRDRYNGGPFLPWIMRIATNFCYDQLRRQKVRKTIPLEPRTEQDEEMESPAWLRDSSLPVEDMLIRSDQMSQVARCLRSLPAVYRQALQLVDIEEFNYTEAAEICGVCVGTFKSRLARARAMMQQRITLN